MGYSPRQSGVLRGLATLLTLASFLLPSTARASAASPRLLSLQRTTGVSTPACLLKLLPRFSGIKNTRTGIISGTWTYSTSTTCNNPMLRLTLSIAVVQGTRQIPTASPVACDRCKAVAIAGAVRCSTCNGRWTFTSYHGIEFPLGFEFMKSTYCTHTLIWMHCTLSAGTRLG